MHDRDLGQKRCGPGHAGHPVVMRTQFGVDIYNLMILDVVTAYNQTFIRGGPWLAPTALQPARYARISMEVSF